MSAILELKHISKHYPDGDELLSILDNLDLSVSAGEFVAILGPQVQVKAHFYLLQGYFLAQIKVVCMSIMRTLRICLKDKEHNCAVKH